MMTMMMAMTMMRMMMMTMMRIMMMMIMMMMIMMMMQTLICSSQCLLGSTSSIQKNCWKFNHEVSGCDWTGDKELLLQSNLY